MTIITFFNSTVNSGSATIALPGSIAANDLGLMFDSAVNGTASLPTTVTPGGWTSLGTQTALSGSAGLRFNVSYKVLTGSEGTLTGMTATAIQDKATGVFRLPAGGIWGTPTNVKQVASATTIANQTVTTSSDDQGAVIAFGDDFGNAGSGAASLTMSPAGTYVDAGVMRLGYLISDSAPASNTISSGVTAGGVLCGLWVPFQLLMPGSVM